MADNNLLLDGLDDEPVDPPVIVKKKRSAPGKHIIDVGETTEKTDPDLLAQLIQIKTRLENHTKQLQRLNVIVSDNEKALHTLENQQSGTPAKITLPPDLHRKTQALFNAEYRRFTHFSYPGFAIQLHELADYLGIQLDDTKPSKIKNSPKPEEKV